MSGRLPYSRRNQYSHMIFEESEVWGRFIDANPGYFDSVDYDFRVGVGAPQDESFTPNYQRMVKMLSQHRIDVLGWNGDKPTIVEVKGRAIISTLGQVLGYKTLFDREHAVFGPAEMLVVCDRIGEDVMMVFDRNKIPYRIV